MIEITATVESLEQAKALLDIGIDTLYFGEEDFGLRLPATFDRKQQKELTELAHACGKKVNIAVNALMHPEKMKKVPEYLAFLDEIHVDSITVGDTGVIYLLNKQNFSFSYIYDGETTTTSARQINFWAKHGAEGAVLAREIPYLELIDMSHELNVFAEILVYGATCIHQSKRPLVRNYFDFIRKSEKVTKERGLFLSEPQSEETHYSIYEDQHGTHIFANNDLDLLPFLDQLYQINFSHWRLDGIYSPGKNFVKIANLFVEAKKLLENDSWDEGEIAELDMRLQAFHPKNRGLDSGFYELDPSDVK